METLDCYQEFLDNKKIQWKLQKIAENVCQKNCQHEKVQWHRILIYKKDFYIWNHFIFIWIAQ